MNEPADTVGSLYPTLIVLLPLLGFLVNGLAGRKLATPSRG